MNSYEPDGADQLQVLFGTVESIRAEKYPGVPAELVRHILVHHTDSAASETDLMRSLERLVDDHLDGRG